MITYQVQVVALVMIGCVRLTDEYSSVPSGFYSDPSTRNKFVFLSFYSIIPWIRTKLFIL
jgi:hypothetical protein